MSGPRPTAEVAGRAGEARRVRVRGVVQGVGFRPFVYRLARAHGARGWVLNDAGGVEIHLEGEPAALDRLLAELAAAPPPASRISELEVAPAAFAGHETFVIRHSARDGAPTTRIAPDLPICAACAAELADPADRRHGYPYINCTDCGPRFSIVLGLPYDRPRTTMRDWPMCPDCAREYEDPLDRRFHAQPVACPVCGPRYELRELSGTRRSDGAAPAAAPDARGDRGARHEVRADVESAGALYGAAATSGDRRRGRVAGAPEPASGEGAAIAEAARCLRDGRIVAVKGIGGYHLACDATDATAVAALRERKFRKERPFAVMVRDLAAARRLVELSAAAEELLGSVARPIVLAPARLDLPGIAPDNRDVGVLLPYAPIHLLLFAAGAPELLVLTSANRASEPIAFRDDEAETRLAGIADALLVGERPIARRVDDSVCRVGPLGPMVLRRARGLAPGAVARLPAARPILAVGADLKSSVTLAVGGEAFVSQHLGDLDHLDAFEAFTATIEDLLAMWEVDRAELVVVHDAHPQYRSTAHALGLPAAARVAVQHHRAHVASVLAEREAWDERVVGVSFDGTGWGDDGTIWGGELFTGSLRGGLERAAHLRGALLPGGDAAARHPAQAAAGFLAEVDGGVEVDFHAPPFSLPERFAQARGLLAAGVRVFPTTSAGRLFDTAAALLGFTRAMSFEGQAAIWLEHLARDAAARAPGRRRAYPFPFDGRELDFRPLLAAVVEERLARRPPAEIAAAFHAGVAGGVAAAARALAEREGARVVVLTGGVFQNALLLEEVVARLESSGLALWVNREVPPNDGGISLGQAALGACEGHLSGG